ncbi:MAG: STAS domain-containing protein [Kiritimatiellae bacterium]|nr:STAS domain-containing protein [Kiritimatiellia bacterium]MDD5522296.1 STAS domain-containing protein [Kiritimatiellia bacterium]
MQFETTIKGNCAVLKVTGRLDAAWADHFHGAVQETIRDGHHHVQIDASGLEYLSSAGIRSLLRIQRELAAVKGSFGIIHASTFVADTLRLSGLQQLMLSEPEHSEKETMRCEAVAPCVEVQPVPGICFEKHPIATKGRITVRRNCRWKPWQPVHNDDAVEISFTRNVFGLGIGAPGKDVDDARTRFGEFIAASGHLVWLPGDGEDTPDYLEQAERFVPRLQVIQSLTGDGDFSHLLRFSPEKKGNFLNLSDLFLQILQTTQSNAAAMIGLVEVEGLVGAAISRSPGLIQATDRPADFPEIRNWLRFCGERIHRQAQALVVAFLSRDPAHVSVSDLSPLPSRPGIRAHAHAVILPYRPLQQGILELEPSVRAVFEDNEPIGLLHLIEDDRPAIGLGQSAFIRGACWCAPFQFSKEPLQ